MKIKAGLIAAALFTMGAVSVEGVPQNVIEAVSGAQSPAQIVELAQQNPQSAAYIFDAAEDLGLGTVSEFLAAALATIPSNDQRVIFVEAATQASPAQAAEIIRIALNGIPVDADIAVQYAQASARGLEKSGISQEELTQYAREVDQSLAGDKQTALLIGQAIADATSTPDDTAETYAFNDQPGEEVETADTLPRNSGGPSGGFRSLGSVFSNFGGGSSAAGATGEDGSDTGVIQNNGDLVIQNNGDITLQNNGNVNIADNGTDPANPAASGN